MQLKKAWAERFARDCASLESTRRCSLAAGQVVYLEVPPGKCFLVRKGYVRLLDSGKHEDRFIRMILGRGGLCGDRPFSAQALEAFTVPLQEQAFSQGPAELLELERAELEAAARTRPEFAVMLLESSASLAQLLERRLGWQFTSPLRVRLAMALRDLICFEGQRCKHGHSVDVRLTHQDLAELMVAARPVVSAELAQLREEGVISYTRSYLCVDNLAGLQRLAGG